MVEDGPHLRGDVVRRSAEGGGGHAVHDALLAHAKVGKLAVTLGVQQDVVQLQVPVAAGRSGWRERQHTVSATCCPKHFTVSLHNAGLREL